MRHKSLTFYGICRTIDSTKPGRGTSDGSMPDGNAVRTERQRPCGRELFLLNKETQELADKFMKSVQRSGCIATCAFCDSVDPDADVITQSVAEPEDLDLMDALFAVQIADFALLCGWDEEETAQYMGHLSFQVLSAVIAERHGLGATEPGAVPTRRPNLKVIAQEKKNKKKDNPDKDED